MNDKFTLAVEHNNFLYVAANNGNTYTARLFKINLDTFTLIEENTYYDGVVDRMLMSYPYIFLGIGTIYILSIRKLNS